MWVRNGLKWVQMGDYGLILWENEALPLISSFRQCWTKKSKTNIEKLPINRPSGRYVIAKNMSVRHLLPKTDPTDPELLSALRQGLW